MVAPRNNLNALEKPGVWVERSHEATPGTYCSICLFDATNFHSECGHDFHILCVQEWSKRNSICPNCRTGLTFKNHAVYCQVCLKKEKVLSFSIILELGRNGVNFDEQTMCTDCKIAKEAKNEQE